MLHYGRLCLNLTSFFGVKLTLVEHFGLSILRVGTSLTYGSQVLKFEGKAESTQLEHLTDTSFLDNLLVLPANYRLDWKVIASYEHSSLFGLVISIEGKKFYNIDTRCQCYKTFFSLQTMRPNKLECLYLAIPFQSSLTFAGSTRSLPKNEGSERSSNWVDSGLAVKF